MSTKLKRREFITVSSSTLVTGALIECAAHAGDTQPRPKKKRNRSRKKTANGYTW